jgi:hypothetical protein
MKYTLIVHEGPQGLQQLQQSQHRGSYLGAWQAYASRLGQAGVLKGGAGLQLPSTATTLHFGPKGIDAQDGPFADSKEQLNGFFVVEADDLDAALDLAKQAPLAPGGVIEVRPVAVAPA